MPVTLVRRPHSAAQQEVRSSAHSSELKREMSSGIALIAFMDRFSIFSWEDAFQTKS